LNKLFPGLAAFAVPLIVYLLSLHPDVGFWDIGEMQTVPYIMGIGHPPGFPTLILCGWLFTHIVYLGSVAFRMNLLCAVSMSGVALLVQRTAAALGAPGWISAGYALVFAVQPIVWAHSIRSDAVDVTLLADVLAILFLLHWRQSGQRRYLVSAALVCGLCVGLHPISVFVIPGALVLIATKTPRMSWRDASIAGALGVAVAITVLAYLPIRSSVVTAARLDPTLSLGIPPGRPYWDYNHPADLSNLIGLLTGAQVHAPAGLRSTYSPPLLLPHLFSYVNELFRQSSLLLLSSILGVVVLMRRNASIAIAFVLLALSVGPFVVSFVGESDPDRYVMLTLAIESVLGAVGVGVAVKAIQIRSGATWPLGTVAAALLFATAAAEAIGARGLFDERYDRLGAVYIRDVIAATPSDAIVIAPWVWATPLAYASFVTRDFGGRIIDTASVADEEPRLSGWIRVRPVYAVSDRIPKSGGVRWHFVQRLHLAADADVDAKLWCASGCWNSH
jgi:hypothetical protein